MITIPTKKAKHPRSTYPQIQNSVFPVIVIGDKKQSATEIIQKLLEKHPDKFPKVLKVTKELKELKLAEYKAKERVIKANEELINAEIKHNLLDKLVAKTVLLQVDVLMKELEGQNKHEGTLP